MSSCGRKGARVDAILDDTRLLLHDMQQPFSSDPTALRFAPAVGFEAEKVVKNDELVEAILEYLTRDTTRPEEPVMHASLEGFFGDAEVVHVHGKVADLDKVQAEIEVAGKAMSRGKSVMFALDLVVQHDVAPCDCAIGLGGLLSGDASQDAAAGPSSSPSLLFSEQIREWRTPDILVSRTFNFVAAEDDSLPPLELEPPGLHPLAGRPKPQEIPSPMKKPRGVSYAAWDNAPLFLGLTADEILQGWVHPVDLQGTLALELAHNHKNSEIAEATAILYERMGLEAPKKSALTYRWTHALKAQCKRDGKDFNDEKKRISGSRRSQNRAVLSTTTATVAPLLGAATPSSLLALTHSQSKETSEDQPSAGHGIDTTSSASKDATGIGDKMEGSGKRKRGASTEVLEDGSDQSNVLQFKAIQSMAASSHEGNDSAVVLDKNSAIRYQHNADTPAEDMSGQDDAEARSAKRQKIDAKKAAGWRI